ncbi:gpi anchored serine-threonine rich [Pyrenophora seminiperda CCB06]|uniref:Gpi anchored serine-threonine rich n=1 Tax=Pyrenophora seminiperda CCB06 TaxID=1302712 RepID=A0A3M7LVE6_9PLEO|nr:gpi anchored serine-threonine rich [Pyrenophora seminiperda CCB06]
MRTSTAVAIVLSASASFVAAQQKCDAQNIVDTCVSGYQDRIDACQKNGNDFICLCDVYRDVLVCYNNCPNSNQRPPVENTVTSYCGAAEPLRAAASSSMASVASVAATQSHASSAAATASATDSSSSGGKATGSAAESAAKTTATSFAGAASANGVKAGAAIVALFAGLL